MKSPEPTAESRDSETGKLGSPEPVAPSPEIQKALESLTEVAGPWIEGIVGHEVILPILTRLYLAAKIEGKEEDARDVCAYCGRGLSPEPPRSPYKGVTHTVSPSGEWALCDASAIHDAIAKLREEAK